MTENDYWPCGLHGAAGRHRGYRGAYRLYPQYIRPEDVPEHTVFVITTDGMENSSRKYSADTVKKLIGRNEEGERLGIPVPGSEY
jgi:hypothetical protein